MDLAAPDREIDAAQRLGAAEALGRPADDEQRLVGAIGSASGRRSTHEILLPVSFNGTDFHPMRLQAGCSNRQGPPRAQSPARDARRDRGRAGGRSVGGKQALLRRRSVARAATVRLRRHRPEGCFHVAVGRDGREYPNSPGDPARCRSGSGSATRLLVGAPIAPMTGAEMHALAGRGLNPAAVGSPTGKDQSANLAAVDHRQLHIAIVRSSSKSASTGRLLGNLAAVAALAARHRPMPRGPARRWCRRAFSATASDDRIRYRSPPRPRHRQERPCPDRLAPKGVRRLGRARGWS